MLNIWPGKSKKTQAGVLDITCINISIVIPAIIPRDLPGFLSTAKRSLYLNRLHNRHLSIILIKFIIR